MTGAADWTGRVGDVWAAEWRRTDRALADLASHLDAAILASAGAGTRTALDIGAGAGATSLALARSRPQLAVTAAELSPGLAAIASQRLGESRNARLVIGDALGVASSVGPVDLFFSRHGVMFFPEPQAAFAALRAAAAPGAALVFSCFASRADNPWSGLIATPPAPAPGYVPGPFAFADPGFVEDMLGRAGWREPTPRCVRFAYRVGAGDDPVGDGADFLSRIGPAASLLRDAGAAERPGLRARLESALRAYRNGDVVDIPAAAWIWTARAAGEHA
ncbi:class I SAM-dependent methyltransferase [Sphingomonas aracearum]|uniref:Class I SAM-dependent methyltransferase n=1 Tax=Sphingomonas aracearum TaxID=2283317 RepID=A0A369VZI8_9SPHN|nr:class I SAM-dependent methyltransferase [Sphingomonas aracearum]RDE06482.1 class I SAM-dependent methyltransferase [Sphingomonas aracearum]